MAFKALPEPATSFSLSLSLQSEPCVLSIPKLLHSFTSPYFHFQQSLFLECSMSFWMERRKWYPQHSQNSTHFQGGPTQIHTDCVWSKRNRLVATMAFHYLSFITEKFHHKIPFQNAIFVFYHFVTVFWMFQSQDETMPSPLPVTTWISTPLPNPLPILLWASCPMT